MKLLLENWRRFLKEEDRDTYDDEVVKKNKATFKSNSLVEEDEVEEGIGAFVPGSSEYKMNKAVRQLKKELADEKHKTTWERIAQELKETQEAWRLLKKWKTLGDFEKEFVWDQIKDVAKTTALGAVLAAPLGAAVWMPLIMPFLKKHGLVASSFMNEEETSCPDSLVVFMAGGPGSGKSSVISGLGLDNFVVLNPDDDFESELASLGISANMQGMSDRRKELRTQLEVEPNPEAEAEVDKITADFSAAMKAFNSANRKHEDEVERLINSEECNSFVVDGTGATFSRMENRVERLKEKGYKVAMVFVDVDPAAAEERNLARSSTGGRSLPTKVIAKTHDKVQANKAAYAKMFGDNFISVDNSGSEEQLKGAMKSAISKLSQI